MWPGSPWLTVDAYKAWARIDAMDTADDVAIQAAVDASQGALQLRAPRAWIPPAEGGEPTWDPRGAQGMLTEAGNLLTNRLMSRRNSPDGVVGVSDMGTATVLSYDADIAQMVAPWTEMVVA